MFNENYWWYTEMNRKQLKTRLAALSLEQLLVYTVGCVTHANEVVRSAVQHEEFAEFQAVEELLKRFWKDYPRSVSGTELAAIALGAEQAVNHELGTEPDEKSLKTPGAEKILWATLYALTLTSAASPVVLAYAALSKSYMAIYDRFAHDEEAINTKRMHEVEKSTQSCVTELAFQIKFLNQLEQSNLMPSSYSEIACYEH